MHRPAWLPAWHYTAFCFFVLVGTVTVTLTTGGTVGIARIDELLWRYRTKVSSADRFARFTSAYQLAAAAHGVPSVTGFIESRQNPMAQEFEVERALKSFNNVVETTPDEDGAWNDLAWLYALHGEISAAIAAEQKAISLYGNDYTYYVCLGAFFERSGRVEEAGLAYGSALRLYPRLMKSPFWHSLQSRRPELANAAIRNAFSSLHQIDAKGDLRAREIIGRLDFETGDVAGAKEILQPIHLALPNLSGTWELQGEIDESEHRTEEAILDYKRAAFLDPGDPLPREREGGLDFRRGHNEESENELLKAWSLVGQLKSPAATRRMVQYGRIDGVRNGELPQALIRETQPAFDFHSAFYGLRGAFTIDGKTDDAEEMQFMADQADHPRSEFGATKTLK